MQNALIAAMLVTVSAGKDNALHLYELQPDSGKLEHHAKYDLPGSPGSQFVSPDGQRLYVSVRSANSVAAFRIDRAGKKLVPLGLTKIGANAAYVATDQTGKTLLWASYSDGVVGSHALAENGAVKPGALSRIETKRCAHAILTDSSNRFAFVPHTGRMQSTNFASMPSQANLRKTIRLLPARPPGSSRDTWRFIPGCRSFIAMMKRRQRYRVSFQPRYRPTQSVPFTKHAADGFRWQPKHLRRHRDHPRWPIRLRLNRGHNSIAGFSVDAKTGKLTSIGQFVTGAIPRSFNLDPDNQWMIAAGQRSHDLHVYKRDSTSGKLNRIYQQPTGQGPSWVQFIPKESK